MAIVTDGLVLYLHGACGKNNPATRVWKDLSGNGNDGQLVNFGYTEDSGWVDGGLRFDGVDDYVDTGKRFTHNDLTLEVTCCLYDVQNIMGSRGGTYWSANPGIELYKGGSYLRFHIGDGENLGFVDTTIADILDSIHTITVVKNQGMLYIYIDGIKVAEESTNVEEFTDENKMRIGQRGVSWVSYQTKMNLYNFKLYNRALTDEEIMQNYQAGHEWTPVKGKREVTTTMKPITSSLSRKGTGKRELISTMKPVTTSLERKGVGKREVITTMKPITSELSRKGVGRREVITTMQPITSSISKKLPPIHANMDIRERTPNITTRERIPKLEVD